MDEDPVILHGPDPVFEPGPGGVGFELYRSLQMHKDKVARYIIETGETCTYGELFEKSKKLAIYLKTLQLKKDDVVCLCSFNQIDSSLPFFAAKFIDVGYASIEPTMPEEDFEYLLDYIKPKVLFVAENAVDKVEACLIKANVEAEVIVLGSFQVLFVAENAVDKVEACLIKANVEAEVIVLGKGQNKLSLEKVLTQAPDEDFSPVIIEDLKKTAIIFFSSGTTGKPKGICCNHYSLIATTVGIAEYLVDIGSYNLSNYNLKLGEDGYYNTLSYSPMYWISGVAFIIMSAFHGSILTLGSSFNSEAYLEASHKYKPLVVFLPPGEVVDVYLKWKEGKYEANENLKLFVTGGGPVRPYHLDYLREMYPKAHTIQMLGMTETTGLITSFDIRDPESLKLQLKYPETCGQVTCGVSMRIVDIDTEQPCGYNQQGELRIKTKYLMNGYHKIDTSACFDKEGWFKTGDLAYINKDNCLVIVDRLKDILLYTLYNIRPSVIEDVLVKHPAVHECFVIGVPHPKDNEHPMGVVKLKNETDGNVDIEEMVDFVNIRVPSDRYKIRAGIKIVKEMIKTPTGKIRKVVMKRMILENKL